MIMNISKSDISNKNLNLLMILNTLIETGSVTEAAKRLRMSQPNLSRALRLLREEFKDPLFVRTSRGITPTKRAEELAAPLRAAMTSLEAVYSKSDFDIRTVRTSFTIFTTDYIEVLLSPPLIKWASKEAPNLTINFRPSHGNIPKAELEKGTCDLNVVVVRETVPPNFFLQELFKDPYLIGMRRGHPLSSSSKVSTEQLLEYGHVLLNPQGTLWSLTDDKLQRIKKERRITVATPNALTSVLAIAKSDLLLTATRKFLEAAGEFFPIDLVPGPFEFDPIRVSQVWHERSQANPLHVYVRQKVKALLVEGSHK